jgi:hypothetical protein
LGYSYNLTIFVFFSLFAIFFLGVVKVTCWFARLFGSGFKAILDSDGAFEEMFSVDETGPEFVIRGVRPEKRKLSRDYPL